MAATNGTDNYAVALASLAPRASGANKTSLLI
jgi:hypothetical protein